MKKIYLFLILLLMAAPFAQAQKKTSTRQDSVKLYLQEMVQEELVPGIILGVYENGKTQFYNYGVADKKKRQL